MILAHDLSPLQYSPTESIPESATSERRPSSNDAGYCSSNNSSSSSLANIHSADDLLPPINRNMNFCNPDDFILSLDTNRSSGLRGNATQGYSDLQPSRFSNPPLIRRNSVAACQARQRGQFSHSENSAFSPSFVSSAKGGVIRGSVYRDPAPGRLHDSCSRLQLASNCEPAMQMLSDPASPQAHNHHATMYSNQHASNLICMNSGEKASDRFSSNPPPTPRRQLSDCAGLNCARFETFPNSEFNNHPSKYQNQCATPPAMRSGVWDAPCSSKPALEELGFMDPSLLTLQANSDCDEKPVDLSQLFTGQNNLEHLHSNARSHESAVMGPVGGSPVARDAVKPRYTSEDEAWKSYLENPLTAATTAMISIHGDEDSAAALGILYDYYKVPREKRILSYHTGDGTEPSSAVTPRKSVVGGNDADSSNSTLSDDVSILSPVSNVSSRAHSNPGNHADLLMRDSSTDVTTTLPCTTHDVSITQSDVITLSAVRSELPTLTEDSSFPPEYSRKFHHPNQGGNSSDSLPRSNEGRSSARYTDSLSPNCFATTFNNNNSNNTTTTAIQSPTSGNSDLVGSPLSAQHSTFPVHSQHDIAAGEYSSGKYFEYLMEAPKSLKQKEGEPTMSYINKGQFYCISLRDCSGIRSRVKGDGRVTSVVQVVFGDGKPEEEQLRHWKYWHSRQHTAKQRVIDIADYKESCMISDIEEFAHNAISFKWDANEPAKIFISCNCLSTDFSAQKGIKGLPLLLQIDTYLDERRVGVPTHRGVCQLKVFCDKGAERKIRDEERKALRKKQKSKVPGAMGMGQSISISPVNIKPSVESPNTTSPPQGGTTASPMTSHKRLDVVRFKTMSDRVTPSVYFVPDVYVPTNRVHVTLSPCQRPSSESLMNGIITPSSVSDLDQVFLNNSVDYSDHLRAPSKRSHSMVSSEDGEAPPGKMSRDGERRVLLYVKEGGEDVYDGVMLREPTLKGLKNAIEEKYSISAEKISKVLKKSKKGIMVNVDDNIVQHYSNEDTFSIEITNEGSGDDVTHQVVLTVV